MDGASKIVFAQLERIRHKISVDQYFSPTKYFISTGFHTMNTKKGDGMWVNGIFSIAWSLMDRQPYLLSYNTSSLILA